MKVVSSEELQKLTGRASPEHTISDYLYEIGRGAATGVGRGVWDRYLAGLDDTAREDLARRMQEIRAERLREHPLGGTTGGKLLQAGGEMMPLLLAGEVLPAAMLARKGVGLGSIAKGMIPFSKTAMPSLRLPAMQRILSAGAAGTIIGGVERKLQEPDANISDVTKHALAQGAMWGAGESLSVALGALVKKFGSQKGLLTTPDEAFAWRAREVFGALDIGKVPAKTGNSESVLYALGINKSMQSELGWDVACQMGRHTFKTGNVPLPQTRLLKAQKTPQGTVDMAEVWIGGIDKKGNNIYNGMPMYSAAKRVEKGFIQSTHMYGVGKDLHHINWVNADLSSAIKDTRLYTDEQLVKRLWNVDFNTPTAYAGLDPEVRTTILARKMDELNTFNKTSRAYRHKTIGVHRKPIHLRKGMRYEGKMHTRKIVDNVMSPIDTEPIIDSADNILKLASKDGVSFTELAAKGVDSPYIEIPNLPLESLTAHVAEEVVTEAGRYNLRGAAKYEGGSIVDYSMNMLQRGFKKVGDMCLVPMWRKGPNTTKLFALMQERSGYQNTLTAKYAKNIAQRSALVQRSIPKKLRKEYMNIAHDLLTESTIQKKFYDTRTAASAALGKVIPEDAWRYYRAEADAVFHIQKQLGEISLIQRGYYKLNPKDPQAVEMMKAVQLQLKKAQKEFYIPMTQRGKKIVMRKGLGVTSSDYSKGSNDMVCLCDSSKEANAAARKFRLEGGDVQIKDNLTQYQADYFNELPSPDMMESILERGGYSSADIQDMMDTMHKLKGNFKLIGRQVERGFDSNKIGLHIQKWSDRVHKAMAREKYKGQLSQLVLDSSGAEDGHYVAEMISRLNTMGGDAFAKTRATIYAWHLGGKISFPIQNSTQSYLNTLPECIDQEGWVQGAKTWWEAHRYMRYFLASPERRLKLADTISDPYLKRGLGQLHNEGIISAGFTQEFMHAQKAFAVQGRFATDVEQWVGLYGTKSEQALRGHAATTALLIAKHKKLPLKVGVELAKRQVNRTQFPFQSYNIPQMFVGGGNMRHASKFLYMYKGFQANQIARTLDVWATGRTRYIAAQALTMSTLYGLAGVPGYTLARKAFMKSTGEDFETKMKNYLKNPSLEQATTGFVDYMFSKGGWKVEAGKAMLNGLPSLAGVSTENWLGLGDVPATDIDQYLGVLNMYQIPIRAYDKLSRGDGVAAFAETMPSAIKNVMMAYRYTKKGLVDSTGQLIYNPTMTEIALKSIGVPSQGITTAYKIKGLVKSDVAVHRANVADFNYKIKEAYKAKDNKQLMVVVREVREYNMQHPARPIKLNFNRLYKEAMERLEPTHMEGVPDWALAKANEYRRAYQ